MMTTEDPFAKFANTIGFRVVRPNDSPEGWRSRLFYRAKRLGFDAEFLNTRLPRNLRTIKSTLRPLSNVPRMSTLANAALINFGVSAMGANQSFVNVGVWNGFTLLAGMIANPEKRCVGVDNFSQFGGPKSDFLQRFDHWKSGHHAFHDLDYKDYFARVHNGPIGFYLYDGDHPYQDQLDALNLAEPFFGPDCLIMVDDTNTPEPRQATLDFIRESKSRYKILFDGVTSCNQHPTWWNGVMLLRRVG